MPGVTEMQLTLGLTPAALNSLLPARSSPRYVMERDAIIAVTHFLTMVMA
jgi:hypothetical protein